MAQPAGQTDYHSLLASLTDENGDRRKQAEAAFNLIPSQEKFSFLGAALCQGELPEHIRILAAVLLRRVCMSGWTDIITSIPADQLRASCNQLLNLLHKSTNESEEVRDKLCQVIAAIGKCHMHDATELNPWSEYLQFIFESLRAPQIELRIAAFVILANSPDAFGFNQGQPACLDVIIPLLLDNLSQFGKQPKFYAELIAAISAYFSTNSGNRYVVKELSCLAVPLAEAMKSVTDESYKEKILQDVIEIAEEAPLGLRPAVTQIMQLCLALMTNTVEADDGIRFSALELAVSLIENAPIMVKKRASTYIKPIVLRILAFMTELDDDSYWHISNTNEKDEEAPDVISESALDRVSIALGGKILLPILMDELTGMLQKPEWQSRHAALMAFSSAGEGCREQLRRILDRVVNGIVTFLADPHPRVRYAACNAIGQMATDFAPEFESKFHAQVLPALCRLLIDNSSRRVQAHAACAMINFFEECQQENLTMYLDMITEHIQNALNQYMTSGIPTDECQIFVLENIIVALSSVADASAENFAKHYEKFMPGLKYIISNSSGKDELRMLRGKAIESVSLIGMAVGKELFCKDASEIMQILLAAQTGELKIDYDDPQLSYMMAAWARICRILGTDFQAYLPYVMGPVLEAAALKVEIALLNDEDKAAIEENDEWESVSVQDQAVGIRTAGLEDKATACSMLVCYARELKHGFVDYVERTAEVLVPLLKFPFHDDVKCAAAEAMPYLLESAKPRGEQFVMLLWNAIFEGIIGALSMDSEPPIFNQMLESLGSSVEVIGPTALTDDKHEKVTMKLIERFNAHFNDLAEEIERRKDEDYESDSECSDDEDCLVGISSLIHSLLTVYGAKYMAHFKQLVPWLSRLNITDQWAPKANKHTALCIWVDVIEYAGPSCAEFQQIFLPLLSASIIDKNSENRQAALYGVGQLAQQTATTFLDFLQSVIPNIIQVINQPDSRSEENVMSTENGISAICRILRYCPQIANHQELLKCWFDWLPIYSDQEEVPIVMEFLISLVEQNNPTVMGANSSNLQRIVAICAETLARCLDAESEIGKKVVEFLRQVEASQPAQVNLNALSDVQKETIRNVLSSK